MCLEGKLVAEAYILGTKNSGTSSLYNDLKKRGIVNTPNGGNIKEWNYFLLGENGTSKQYWLSQHRFCPKRTKHMVDFAVTNLFTIPMPSDLKHSMDYGYPAKNGNTSDPCFTWNTPAIVSKWYGQSGKRLKFVIMLREPLSRLQSEWYHTHELENCPGCMAKDSFQRALEFNVNLTFQNPPEITDWIWKSMYARHIEGWLSYFPAGQFIIIPYKFYVKHDTIGISKFFIALFHLRSAPWGTPAHQNVHTKPTLEEELPFGHPVRDSYNNFMATENSRLVELLTKLGQDGGTLYGFKGDLSDTRSINQWLKFGW